MAAKGGFGRLGCLLLLPLRLGTCNSGAFAPGLPHAATALHRSAGCISDSLPVHTVCVPKLTSFGFAVSFCRWLLPLSRLKIFARRL